MLQETAPWAKAKPSTRPWVTRPRPSWGPLARLEDEMSALSLI